MRKNIKKYIKNYLRNFITMFLLICLIIAPIMADGKKVYIVNGSDFIRSYFKTYFKNYIFANLDWNEDYWASDINISKKLIWDKSEQLANYIYQKEGSTLESLVLIGFSQGGLRVRSMAQYFQEKYQNFASKIKGIIVIDSPNMGGYIARKENIQNFCNYAGDCLIGTGICATSIIGIYGLLVSTLSNEELSEWEKSEENISLFAQSKLSSFLDIENIKEYINALKNNEIDKGILLKTNCGRNLLFKLFNVNEGKGKWFYEIFNGALEDRAALGNNDFADHVIEVTKEFRPGSEFLNYLNNDENLELEKKFKRVALIGTNGNLKNLECGKNIIDIVTLSHFGLFSLYLLNGLIYSKSIFTWNKAIYCFYKSGLNFVAMVQWSALPSKFSYCVTNRRSNSDDHDLLIPKENQQLPGFRGEEKGDKHIYMSAVNHIVPSVGVDYLISSLRDLAKRQFDRAAFDSNEFINSSNQ